MALVEGLRHLRIEILNGVGSTTHSSNITDLQPYLPKVKGCSQVLQEIATLRQYISQGLIEGSYMVGSCTGALDCIDVAKIFCQFRGVSGLEFNILLSKEAGTFVRYAFNGNEVTSVQLLDGIKQLKKTLPKVTTSVKKDSNKDVIAKTWDYLNSIYNLADYAESINTCLFYSSVGKMSRGNKQFARGFECKADLLSDSIRFTFSDINEGKTERGSYNNSKCQVKLFPQEISEKGLNNFLKKLGVDTEARGLKDYNCPYIPNSITNAWRLARRLVDTSKPNYKVSSDKIVFYKTNDKCFELTLSLKAIKFTFTNNSQVGEPSKTFSYPSNIGKDDFCLGIQNYLLEV